jgi:hypothetical protein
MQRLSSVLGKADIKAATRVVRFVPVAELGIGAGYILR